LATPLSLSSNILAIFLDRWFLTVARAYGSKNGITMKRIKKIPVYTKFTRLDTQAWEVAAAVVVEVRVTMNPMLIKTAVSIQMNQNT